MKYRRKKGRNYCEFVIIGYCYYQHSAKEMTINKIPCAAFLQCVVLGESLDCGEGRRSLLISKRVVAWATLATSECLGNRGWSRTLGGVRT